MTDNVFVVAVTYRPKRRVVYGNRTKNHTYYQVFETDVDSRRAAFALAADERKSADKWGRDPFVGVSCSLKPRSQWPGDPGVWISLDKVEAKRKREAAKRVAAARKLVDERRKGATVD